MNGLNLEVNMTYGSGYMNDTNDENTKLVMFLLWGIFLPLIAGVGLVGNVLTMVVLWRKEMQSTTILYLRALVITDTGILIGAVITLTPISCANYLHGEALTYFKNFIYPYIHTPGYYIVMTLQQCNVWITVSVSMERYIAICHPFRAARLITRRKTYIVIFAFVVISCLYNIPHLYATYAEAKYEDCSQGAGDHVKPTIMSKSGDYNMGRQITTDSWLDASVLSDVTTSDGSQTSRRLFCYEVIDTSFGTSDVYTAYRTYLYSAIIYVVPFLALVVLNSFLIKELMVMQKRRSGTNINEENEANLSLVLVLIVIVFMFCQTPGLVSQFDVIPAHVFYSWLAVSNLLFTTNSAVNFLIYTAFGRKFRKVLLRVFRRIYRTKSQNGCRPSQFTMNGYEMSALGNSIETKGLKKKQKECKSVYSNGKQRECSPLADGDLRDTQNTLVDSMGSSNGSVKT